MDHLLTGIVVNPIGTLAGLMEYQFAAPGKFMLGVCLLATLMGNVGLYGHAETDPYQRLDELKKKAPKAVTIVIDRHLECYHWAGEPGYDKARAKFIEKAVEKCRCDSVDSDETLLLKKYKNNKDIRELIQLVRELEPFR